MFRPYTVNEDKWNKWEPVTDNYRAAKRFWTEHRAVLWVLAQDTRDRNARSFQVLRYGAVVLTITR